MPTNGKLNLLRKTLMRNWYNVVELPHMGISDYREVWKYMQDEAKELLKKLNNVPD